MSIKPWISALNVPKATYDSWAEMHGPNESTLFWCLLNDQISSSEYFAWAQEHFGLAFLSSDFFKQDANLALWDKFSSLPNWSAECMPVFEWDGVLFIACVEPQTHVRWSLPVQYILADAVDLKMHWKKLNPEPRIDAATSPSIQLDVKTALHTALPIFNSAPTSPVVETFAPAAHNVPPASDSPTAGDTEPPPLDAPQGLVFNLGKSVAPALKFDAPEGLVFAPSLAPEVKAPEVAFAPEGLSLTNFKVPDLASLAPVGLEGAAIELDKVDKATKSEHAPAGSPGTTEEILSLGPAVSPAFSASMPSTLADSGTMSVIQFKQTTPTPSGSPPPNVAASGSGLSQNKFVEFLYSLEASFAGGMILQVSQDQFKPLAWDSKFKPATEKAEAYWTLNSPSAFRVAYRTQMPYLGHIVETPINKDFFAAWSFTELPKYVLIQPVKVEEKIAYLIVMLTDATKKNHHLITSGEKSASELLRLISSSEAA